MSQPIRKNIQDSHGDKLRKEPYRTLLVDGNGLLFLSMRDESRNPETDIHYGGIFQFLLQLRIMLSKGEIRHVYVFFDDEYSGLLRYQLYPYYKANRDKHYSDYGGSPYWKAYNAKLNSMRDYLFNKKTVRAPREKSEWDKFIDENFNRERDTLRKYFEEMSIRCYMDDVVEGDDLIAYYCLHKEENEKVIIMTGDMDIMQLLADDIAVYSLRDKKFITTKNFQQLYGFPYQNVVVKKILCGDTSDNIGNIKGLSEEGFFNLMPEAKIKPVTVEDVKNKARSLIEERKSEKKKPLMVHENILKGVTNKQYGKYGGDFYSINQKLIDLSNPLLTKEAEETMDSMMHAPIDPDGRSFKNVYTYILDDGINQLYSETKFASFMAPFKRLEDSERKFFEESLK